MYYRLTIMKISIRPRLELDGPGLLHPTSTCNIHENALLRVRYPRNY